MIPNAHSPLPLQQCQKQDVQELTVGLMSDADVEKGGKSSNASEGISVARDNDARLSMIKFTHNICTAVRGLSWLATAPVHAVATATMFTTNCSIQEGLSGS